MPLSEEELRLLEQMERALAAEDPKFASVLQGRSMRRAARMRVVGAAVAFVAGIGLLMGGAMASATWLGVIGFLIMLGAATLGLASWRGQRAPEQPAQAPQADGLFDFDDHPHRFDVIPGGKAKRGAGRQRKPKRPRQRRSGTMMQRFEQRWQRRRDQGY